MLKLCILVLVASVLYVQLSEANNQHSKRQQRNHSVQRNSNQSHRAQTHNQAQRNRVQRNKVTKAHNKNAHATVSKKASAHKPAARRAATKPAQKPGARKSAARRAATKPAHTSSSKTKANKKKQRQAKAPGRTPNIGKGALSLKMKPKRAGKKCTDKASNCDVFVNYCTVSTYVSLLKTYCNMGCGYCAPSGSDCVDKFSTCAQWNRKGFCNASFMTLAGKRSMCAKTCNLCAEDTQTACTATPYTEACLPETCKKDAEKDKTDCQNFCSTGGKGEKQQVCLCTEAANKYKQWCGEQTCKDANEKKQTTGCTDFCRKPENTNKDVCNCAKTENTGAYWCTNSAPATCTNKADANYYSDACAATVCAKPDEKTNTDVKSCKSLCLTEKNKNLPACDCNLAENKGKAEWCKLSEDADCKTKSDTVKFFSDKCIPVACAINAEKKDNSSPCATKCKDNLHKDTAACKCTFDDNKKDATWCQTATSTDPDCQPANKAVNPATYYKNECIDTVCAIQAEKADSAGTCKTKCTSPPNDSKNVCKCSDPQNQGGKASWCPDLECHNRLDATKYFKDECLDTVCARPGEKLDWTSGSCKDKCKSGASGASKTGCSCTDPKNTGGLASWCAEAKTYTNCATPTTNTAPCNVERCADPAQKENPLCTAFCDPTGPNINAAPCVCTDAANKLAKWCPTQSAAFCANTAANAAEIEKPWGQCYYHCKARAGDTPARTECDCSTLTPPKSDYCLEQACKDQTKTTWTPECQTWCQKPENKDRKGCQ